MGCYCGSKKEFDQCCNPIIQRKSIANTPEQLMRSRYSAYASKSAEYIYNTYADETRGTQCLNDIEVWAAQTQWLNLTITSSDNVSLSQTNGPSNNEHAMVHFSATYIHDGTLCQMDEVSRFVEENNQWRYLDGEIIKHIEIASPNRNEPCPCMSGKKFKRCCISKLP